MVGVAVNVTELPAQTVWLGVVIFTEAANATEVASVMVMAVATLYLS